MTIRLCVAGHPVDHSKSPEIHHQFAAQLGHDVTYSKMDVQPGTFAERADDFLRRDGGLGMNVTVPLKEEAFEYADELSPEAKTARAVNTLKNIDGRIYGHNTDGPGFVLDLKQRWQQNLTGKRVLVLGAGGSTMGLLQPILNERPSWLAVANRTKAKAEQLVAQFSQCDAAIGLPVTKKNSGSGPVDVIINTTAVGLQDEPIDNLLDAELVNNAFCYDLSYGAQARFAAWCAQQGAQGYADGLGMLVEQAAESYDLWMGERPETEPVYSALR